LKLLGGGKKRVTIAKMLLKLGGLIFDEAASALDSSTEISVTISKNFQYYYDSNVSPVYVVLRLGNTPTLHT
jgi:ABC-type transport system involved in Fe-S cluster assembly fused permease/ATPase subunit